MADTHSFSNTPRLHPLIGATAVMVILTCGVGLFRMLDHHPASVPLTTVDSPSASPVVAPVTVSGASTPSVASASSLNAAIVPTLSASPASSTVGAIDRTPSVVHDAQPASSSFHTHRLPHLSLHRSSSAHAATPSLPVVSSTPVEDPSLYDHSPNNYMQSSDGGRAAQPLATMGTVVAIEAITQPSSTSGIGGAGGAALGGFVGNHFGHGRGRIATTVLGVVGGALAGNAVEKGLTSSPVVYRMTVRTMSGAYQTFVQNQPFAFAMGDAVQMVNGQVYRR